MQRAANASAAEVDAAGLTTPTAPGAPVAILANGNQGDMISLYASFGPHACADLAGHRLAAGMHELCEEAGSRLRREFPIGVRWTRIGAGRAALVVVAAAALARTRRPRGNGPEIPAGQGV